MVRRNIDRARRRLQRSDRFRAHCVAEIRPFGVGTRLDEPPDSEDPPEVPADVGRLGGKIAGDFRCNPAGQRQHDRVQREVREHALRGFAGGFPQSGSTGACRPVPDDASNAFSDSLDKPEKVVAEAVRGLATDGSS